MCASRLPAPTRTLDLEEHHAEGDHRQRCARCVRAGHHTGFAQVKIGVTVSATGPAASLGIPERNTVAMCPKEVGGKTVEYIELDDASDTTTAVQNARKLVGESKVDAIIGSTTTPNSLAMLDVFADAQTPGTAEFRRALRDALEATKNLPVTNRVVNMTPKDHLRLDSRARVMVRIEGGTWSLEK